MLRDPIIGDNSPGATTCTRMVEGGQCGKAGAWHIVWDGRLSSVARPTCAVDVREGNRHMEAHVFQPPCVDLMSLWYQDEHTCRRPRDCADAARGVYLVGK